MGRAPCSRHAANRYRPRQSVCPTLASAVQGPQPLQILLSSVDCNCGSLGVAADIGVKEVKDLKGKRIGFVVGSPALNQNSLAVLAFGGLTQKDVKVVEFASYGAMWKGLINNGVPSSSSSASSPAAAC
jgi:TRAP transporter TAXI family solute receptor